MAKSDFRELDGKKKIKGERQLIVCGFKEKEQKLLKKIVRKMNLELAMVFLGDGDANKKISEINGLPNGYGAGEKTSFESAVVVAGIRASEFSRLIDRVKKSYIGRVTWASVTETSWNWSLKDLLQELFRERDTMG